MSIYVLVHGAWHGAWCWYKVLPLLERGGHKVIAPDLPGLGRDVTPLDQISLDSWADFVRQIVEAQPEPVVLVGHSRAGIILSTVAERCPWKIASLVYVTAALVRDRESFLQLTLADATSLIMPNQVVAPDGRSFTIRDEALTEVFYGECPDEDVALARLLLRPEPTAPMKTRVHITGDSFGAVPRIYVECLRDKAIPRSLQKTMYSALPCQKVMTIDTDHSPFFSAPEQLAEYLVSIDSLRAHAP